MILAVLRASTGITACARRARSCSGGSKPRTLQELNDLCPAGLGGECVLSVKCLTYWDMVSAIVKRDVVDKELFYETNGELTAVWEKVKHLIPGASRRRSA